MKAGMLSWLETVFQGCKFPDGGAGSKGGRFQENPTTGSEDQMRN